MTVTEEAVGLADRLREATTPEHRDTENRGFITRLMGGELSLEAYTAYLAQYAYIYRALEAREIQDDDPAFLKDLGLIRTPSIESDLAHLGVTGLEAQHPILPATTLRRSTRFFRRRPRTSRTSRASTTATCPATSRITTPATWVT